MATSATVIRSIHSVPFREAPLEPPEIPVRIEAEVEATFSGIPHIVIKRNRNKQHTIKRSSVKRF